MIRLEGLTRKDVEICNLLWSCETTADVNRMVSAMPTQYRQRAQTLRELMCAAVLDSVEDIDPNVTALLQHIASR